MHWFAVSAKSREGPQGGSGILFTCAVSSRAWWLCVQGALCFFYLLMKVWCSSKIWIELISELNPGILFPSADDNLLFRWKVKWEIKWGQVVLGCYWVNSVGKWFDSELTYMQKVNRPPCRKWIDSHAGSESTHMQEVNRRTCRKWFDLHAGSESTHMQEVNRTLCRKWIDSHAGGKSTPMQEVNWLTYWRWIDSHAGSKLTHMREVNRLPCRKWIDTHTGGESTHMQKVNRPRIQDKSSESNVTQVSLWSEHVSI